MYRKALYAGEWASETLKKIGNERVLTVPTEFSLVVDMDGSLSLDGHDISASGRRAVFRFRGLCIGAVLEAVPSVCFYGFLAEGDPDGTRRKDFMALCVRKHHEIHQGAE